MNCTTLVHWFKEVSTGTKTVVTILHFFFFEDRFITQTVHTGCTRINYKIVPVTNFNKYLHNGTRGDE